MSDGRSPGETRDMLIYFYFIMNQEIESYRQDLYMRIGTMKDSKTKTEESTRLTYNTGLYHSCCHTYLETSVSER
jgi:hypothetical protein